jgi:acyl-CoA reductase-like NAD-dependent aldehyde dehydrogenase
MSGTVNVNEAYAATWGSVGAPMGGWKDSGVGGYARAMTAAMRALQRLPGRT